jgi:O-antigen/teichoic acid export membrane protein
VFLPQKAVLGAGIYSALVLAGVAIVYKLHLLSPFSAFLLLGAGAVATGPMMLRWLKPGLIQTQPVFKIRDIYYPLLGSFFTLAEAGRFKALMNLASPIGQAFAAVSLLSLSHVSRAHHQDGSAASERLAWRVSVVYVGGTCLYWAVLLLLRGPIVHQLYGGKYMEVVSLLPWVALGSILRISATAQTLVLKAMRSPAMACVAYSAAGVVAVLVGVPFTRWFGLQGALFAWVLSSAAGLVGAVIMLRQKVSKSRVSKEGPAAALVLHEEASISTQ